MSALPPVHVPLLLVSNQFAPDSVTVGVPLPHGHSAAGVTDAVTSSDLSPWPSQIRSSVKLIVKAPGAHFGVQAATTVDDRTNGVVQPTAPAAAAVFKIERRSVRDPPLSSSFTTVRLRSIDCLEIASPRSASIVTRSAPAVASRVNIVRFGESLSADAATVLGSTRRAW